MISIGKDVARQVRLQRALDKCPRCGQGPMIVDAESGEMICSNCGFVVKEKIEDTGPEWRSYSKEEGKDESRAGLPTSIAAHDMGLSTVIGTSNRDSTGRPISGSMRTTVDRLRTWDRRSQVHESMDRNLSKAFMQLRTFADKLALSNESVERAAYIYRKALERGLIRGRSITEMMAASLYAACRDSEIPRTLKDVANVANINKKDLARSYRLLVREMDIRMPVPDPAKSVTKIASRVSAGERTRRRALEILSKAKEKGVAAGKDPVGLAASALYVASTLSGEEKTQRDIAQAAGVTEVTIRNRYKNLRNALGI
jgi:transcription initiation factor TFIIB